MSSKDPPQEILEQYDKKYIFDNTIVYVVSPKITEEEKKKRWEDVCRIASAIVEQLMK
ncbi:MAG: hypothetical protein QJR05_10995 [Thermoanaerobacterium sp.]|nr:hypothetical protein [Thermoanaerobacterium sp.]